jgi:hypothetical protein
LRYAVKSSTSLLLSAAPKSPEAKNIGAMLFILFFGTDSFGTECDGDFAILTFEKRLTRLLLVIQTVTGANTGRIAALRDGTVVSV